MYFQVVHQCIQNLKNVELWLDKAEAVAAEKKFDSAILLQSRLSPDMKPLLFHIQTACDFVKGAATRLSGQPVPKHDDNEQTLADVRERVRKSIAIAEGVSEAQYAGADSVTVTFPFAPGKQIGASDYLLQMVIPNVYFHLTMAYAILRHNGVNVGKMDFLQPLNFVDV